MKKDNKSEGAILRQRAEELVKRNLSKSGSQHSGADILKLIHELEVHQIELEMQNEELRLAKEREVKLATKKYIELYDFAPSGYFTLSKAGKIIELNLSGANMLGKERSRLKNSLFSSFVSDATKPAFNLFLGKVFSSKVRETCEVSLSISGNVPMYVYLSGIFTENVEHCHVTVLDITERKQAEENLSRSEEKYRGIFENVQDVYYETLIDGTILEVSPSIGILSKGGYHRDDLIGKSMYDFYSNSDSRNAVITLLLERGSVTDFEVILKNHDGSNVPCSISAKIQLDVHGRPFKIIGSMRDITKRKHAEESLKKQKDEFETIFNLVPAQILYKDTHNNFIHVNHQACIDIGMTIDKIEGHSAEELFPSFAQQYFMDDLEVINAGKPKLGISEPFNTANGEIRWVHTDKVPVFGNDGKVNGIIAFVQDITERKRAEEALRESEKNLQEAQRLSQIGSWQWIEATDTVKWSEELYHMNGRDPNLSPPCFAEMSSCYTPESWKRLSTMVAEALQSGGSYELDLEIVRPDSTTRLTYARGEAEYDTSGKVVGLHGTVQDITRRKQAGEALRESEQRLNFHINNSPLATIEWNTDFVVTRWSDEAEKIFGWNQSETIGKPIMDFPIIYDEDIPIVQKTMERLYDGSSKHVVSANRNYTKSKKVIYCEWYNSVLLSPQGKMISVMSQVMDITERKQAEEALVKLNKAIYTSGEAIFLTDREGVFTFVNPAFTALYGYSSEEIVGKVSPRILKSGLMEENDYKLFWETLLSGKEVRGELINKRKDGTSITIESTSSPIFDENKNIIGFLGIQRDITERKRAEERLRQQIDAMEAAIDGMALLNADGNYIYLNKSHVRIYGYDNAIELIGASWRILYNTDELQRFDQEIIPELNQNGHYQGRALGKKKNGSTFHQELSLTTLENGGLICNVRDITELKHEEQELIMAKEKAEESDRLKSAFLANMSHEVRTPLNSIIGFSELLADPDFEEEQKDEFIQHIITSGNNLLSLISDIMDISKMESGEIKIRKSQINAQKFISTIKEQFAIQTEGKKLEFKLNHPDKDEDTVIFADADRLKQIFNNLLSNAIKFTMIGSIEIGYQPKGKMVEFYVKDTGIGIPAEYHDVIFERFRQVDTATTRKFGGNGLGLAISKNLVEIMGGKIWLESESGKGSVFYFTLPAHNCKL